MLNPSKVWISVKVRYGYWLILKDRADKNGTSISKEMEKILVKELDGMMKA